MFVRWWRQGLAGLVVVAVLAAFVLPASWWGPSAPPSQQLFEILVESKKAAELAKATAPERSGEFQAHGASRYGRQMIALAERYPKDPAAVEALILVVSRWGGHSPEADQAFQLLLNRQLNSPELMELIRALLPAPKPWRTMRLREIAVAAIDPMAASLAYLHLAGAADEATSDVATIAGAAAAADQQAAIRNYELAAAKDPGGEVGRVAQPARAMIRRLQTIGVGRPALPIDGPDLQGNPLTLAEFKGQVVLLDFWALWCQPCWREVPKYKKLLERFAGQPLTILGVLAESDRAWAEQATGKNGVTWRNWLDPPVGGKRPGPINSAWAVDAYPTVFVIDGRGVIRARGPFRDHASLENLIARMLDEKDRP